MKRRTDCPATKIPSETNVAQPHAGTRAAPAHARTHRVASWTRPPLAAALACTLALGACASEGPQVTVLPSQIAYTCRDGSAFQVRRQPDGRTAEVLRNGKVIALPRTDSAAQEKYSNGTTTLYLDGEKALLTSDSFVVAGDCVSVAPLPAVPMEQQ
jgi:membrane-bound inhibitor of C-type lysozyme